MNKNNSAQPVLSDVFDEFKRTLLRDMNCIKLGKIESYDIATQTVTVKFINKVLVETQSGKNVYRERPVLLEVPIIILSGGDSYLSFPISSGDDCLLFFNDRDVDNWYLEGNVTTPNTNRTHDLSDAFAIVGIRNSQNLFSDIESDKVKLQFNSTNKIEIEDGEINITSPNTIANGDFETTGNAKLATAEVVNGASGTFISQDAKTVTVVDGIVTSII